MGFPRWTAAVLALSLASAQTPVIRINVNLIQIDAIVTDSKGHPVTDLKAEDFVVLQDGKPQPVSNFAFVNTREATIRTSPPGKIAHPKGIAAPPPPPSVALKPEQIRRTIALVVDDLGLSSESIARVRDSLRKWVDREMQPGDLVAVIRTGAGMGALQQFTSDKRMLYAAINRVMYNARGRVGVSSFAPLEAVNAGTSIDTTAADEERERIFSAGSLGAIQYVVEGLREVPGRKSVILFSESLRMMFSDGRSAQVQERLQRLGDAANRSSVVIYGIDPRGLIYTGLTAADNTSGRTARQIAQVHPQRSQQLFDSQEGMVLLARETGGLFLQNSNDIDGQLRKVVEDGEGYYLLGYHPDASTFDQKTGKPKFHNLEVRVKRSGLRVRSRRGFFGASDKEIAPLPHTRQAQIAKALFSPFATGALHLRLTTLFGQSEKDGPYVTALLHFDPRELKFTDEPDDWHKAVVDTVAITFGPDGRQVDAADKTWTIRAKGKSLEEIKRMGIVYRLTIAMKQPGGYQMRVVLRDQSSEQVGSATQFIDVPDVSKGRLTLSSLVLSAERPAAAKPEAASEEEGQVADQDPNGTPAVRIFKPGAALGYAYQILNARAGTERKPDLETQVRLFREGQEVYAGKPAPLNAGVVEDAKGLLVSGNIRFGHISPGEYVLQVIVSDKLSKDKSRVATQSMDFEIQEAGQ